MHQRLIVRAATVLLGLVALAGPVVPAQAAVGPTPVPSPVVGEANRTPQPAESDEPGRREPDSEQDKFGDGDHAEGLPVTGAQVGGMVVFGGGLIAAGIAMVAVRRRGPIDPDVIGR